MNPSITLLLALALSGCAETWQTAYERAEASGTPIERAELALLADENPELAAELAEQILGNKTSEYAIFRRAFSLLLASSDALTAFERPLAHLGTAIDRAVAANAPEDAERFASQAVRAWGRLDGESVLSEDIRLALERLSKLPGDRWHRARDAALRELVTVERLRKGPSGTREASRRAGYLLDWRLSAPWGDAPFLDFLEPLGPETRPLLDSETTGSGWSTRPIATTSSRFSDGEVVFFDMPSSGAVGFAESSLELPSSALSLALESNRLAEVYLDNERVLSRDDLGGPALVTAILPHTGKPRRVLVKLASSDGKGYFRLQALPLATVSQNPHTPRPLEVGLSEPVISALLDLESRLSRPLLDLRGARSRLADLESLLGPHLALDLLAARRALSDTSLPESLRHEQARERFSRILSKSPGHPGATRGLARLEREANRLDQAMSLLTDMTDPRHALDLLGLYRQRGAEVESLRLAESLLPLAQKSPRVAHELIDTYRAFGRIANAQRLAEDLETRFPGSGGDRLAELLLDRGEPPIDAQLDQFSYEPQRHALLRASISALRTKGDLDRAEALLEDFLLSRPEDGWALGELARIALQRGNVGLALDRIRRTLELHPDFAPLESLGHHLEGGPEPFDTLEDGHAVLSRWKSYAATEAGTAASAFPIVQLLERTRTDIRADGSTVELTHRIRLVQNKQGADALGEVRPPDGARLLVVRTLKADGRILDPERTEGKADLSFPELAPGDAVETAWVTRNRVSPGEGGYLTGVSFAGWGAPIFELDASFIAARGLDLVVTSFGGAPAPTRTTEDGRVKLAWNLARLPAIPREPLSISARSFFPFADLRVVSMHRGDSVTSAWQAIARAYASRLGFLSRKGPALAGMVSKLSKLKNPTAEAFYFVKSDINDLEQLNAFETPVERAIASRKGNRALVLTALLDSLLPGRSVELLLCAPERDGPPEDRMAPTPNPNRFFYPIVSLDMKVFLDPSRPYTPVGDIPPELDHARCFVPARIARSKASDTPLDLFLDLPARSPSSPTFDLSLSLTLDRSGDAAGRLTLSAFGASASPLRQAFLAQDDARKRILFEQWLGSILVGARLVDYRADDVDVADRPFRVVIELDIPGYASPNSSGGLVIAEPIAPLATVDFAGVPGLAQLVGQPMRNTPLRLLPHSERVTLTLRAPGLHPLAPPSLEGEVSQKVEIDNDTLVIRRHALLRPGRVDPTAYQAFRDRTSTAIRILETPIEFAR
jgi:tetratricopeptide (TPR) repeat protein